MFRGQCYFYYVARGQCYFPYVARGQRYFPDVARGQCYFPDVARGHTCPIDGCAVQVRSGSSSSVDVDRRLFHVRF